MSDLSPLVLPNELGCLREDFKMLLVED